MSRTSSGPEAVALTGNASAQVTTSAVRETLRVLLSLDNVIDRPCELPGGEDDGISIAIAFAPCDDDASSVQLRVSGDRSAKTSETKRLDSDP